MRKIVKSPEPQAWIDHRRTLGSQYEAIDGLRGSLLEEQGFICAYCMQRLRAPKEEKEKKRVTTTRIEHLKCRSGHSHLTMDYNNMVICCSGKSDSYIHCDRHKGDRDISFDLFSDRFFRTLSYSTSRGTIKSSNDQWNAELDDVLNLNNPVLKGNRKSVLDGVVASLGKRGKDWTLRELQRTRERWNEMDCNGEYQPFCGTVVWFLDRAIAQRT